MQFLQLCNSYLGGTYLHTMRESSSLIGQLHKIHVATIPYLVQSTKPNPQFNTTTTTTNPQKTMNASIQKSLTNLDQSLTTLLTTLTTSPTASGAPAAALTLLSADDALTSAITTLREHQENYAKILRLRAEAARLEERVRGVVGDIGGFVGGLSGWVHGGDSEDESESEDESDVDSDLELGGHLEGDTTTRTAGMRPQTETKPKTKTKTNEVDYKLLLDFARRISKYNHQAAADAEAGSLGPIVKFREDQQLRQQPEEGEQQEKGQEDIDMTGVSVHGTDTQTQTQTQQATDTTTTAPVPAPTQPEPVPVSSITKPATSWLDESAHQTRQIYMLPYPMEDRIRMGLMGQIQLAAAEGRPGFDPDKEVERLIREAEGLGGVGDAVAPVPVPGSVSVGDGGIRGDGAANVGSVAAAAAGTATGGGGARAPPAPKPKATLDLDLYDPEDDDI